MAEPVLAGEERGRELAQQDAVRVGAVSPVLVPPHADPDAHDVIGVPARVLGVGRRGGGEEGLAEVEDALEAPPEAADRRTVPGPFSSGCSAPGNPATQAKSSRPAPAVFEQASSAFCSNSLTIELSG